jgi:hypothetical protein
MRTLATFVFVSCLVAAQQKPADPVILAPEALQAALKELEKGLSGKPEEKVAAVRKAAKVDHEKIAAALARPLADKEPTVRKAAVLGLRYMKNPAALTSLLAAAERFREDAEVGPAYYMALGQHGDEKALPVLMDGSWNEKETRTFDARMSAVAHIRSNKSVEELMDLWNKTGRGKTGANFGPRTQYVNRALRMLTGQKELGTAEEWRAWWREHKDGFKVSAEPKNLGKSDQNAWKVLWSGPDAEGSKQEPQHGEKDHGGDEHGKGEGEGKDPGTKDGESGEGRRRRRKDK